MIPQTIAFYVLSLAQVSSRRDKSYSSLYSLVCFSIDRSYLIVSTMFLISSSTCSSLASRAFRSALTVFAIVSVSSTTRLISNVSYSCLSCDSAWLQSWSLGKSASSSSSRIPTFSLRSLVCFMISFWSIEHLSSIKAIICLSVSRRVYKEKYITHLFNSLE